MKIHAESLQVRNLAKIGKLYTKECYFYSTFRKNCNLTTPEPYGKRLNSIVNFYHFINFFSAVFREGDEFFMLIMEDINLGGWIAFDSAYASFIEVKITEKISVERKRRPFTNSIRKNMANYEEILGFVAEFSHHIHAPFANKVLEYPFLSDGIGFIYHLNCFLIIFFFVSDISGAIGEYEMFIKALPKAFYTWKEAFTPRFELRN